MSTADAAGPPSDPNPDPKPEPPREPGADECCGGGCTPCVYDLYWDAYARYEDALGRWQARKSSK